VSPQSPTEPPVTKRPVGLSVVLGAPVNPYLRQHGLDILLHHRLAQRLGRDIGTVLGGQHHGLDPDRLVILVAQRNLALRIRAQPRDLAGLAHLRLALDQAVRERDQRRHRHVGLVRGITEHQPLIARALAALVLAVDPPGNIRRLLADDIEHAAARAVEPHLRGVVADALVCSAGDETGSHNPPDGFLISYCLGNALCTEAAQACKRVQFGMIGSFHVNWLSDVRGLRTILVSPEQ